MSRDLCKSFFDLEAGRSAIETEGRSELENFALLLLEQLPRFGVCLLLPLLHISSDYISAAAGRPSPEEEPNARHNGKDEEESGCDELTENCGNQS